MATDKITYDEAQAIDRDWCDARWPSDGLRIVTNRVGGHGNETFLMVPDTNYSPLYQWRSHEPETGIFAPAFYHVAGPTLAEWGEHMEAIEYAREAAELRAWASGH